jgi:formylmethanofuran dehydrogenase subunit B
MSNDAINEIVLTKAAKAKKKESSNVAEVAQSNEYQECTLVSVEEAKDQIKNRLSSVKEEILAILSNVKLETVKQGVDLFEGLESEFDEISKEIAS